MRHPSSILVVALALASAAVVAGCSSPQSGDDDTVTDPGAGTPVDGEEDPVEPAEPLETDEPDRAPEPAAGGEGRLRIKVLASGEPAAGRLRVLTADVEPRVVQEGSAAGTFDLPAGRYDVEVVMEDTLDRPEKRLRDVPVKAGDTTERDVNFPVGVIKLQPRRGSAAVQSKVRWRYNGGGDWFAGESQTGEDLTLSCGRYDAEITVGRTAIVIEDIQVYEGRRTVSPPITVSGGRR